MWHITRKLLCMSIDNQHQYSWKHVVATRHVQLVQQDVRIKSILSRADCHKLRAQLYRPVHAQLLSLPGFLLM
jgi:hypothetical protein